MLMILRVSSISCWESSEKRLTAAANEAAGSASGEGYLGVWLQACVDVAGQY